MKLYTALSIVTTLFVSTQANSLRGLDTEVRGPFDSLKCTFEARADEEKCHESVDVEGNPCDYCSVSSNGQEAGICVTSALADQMQQINPEITCEESNLSSYDDDDDDNERIELELSTDISSAQCTISAFTDEGKCAQVANESCQYCEVGIDGHEAGLCVGADVADKLMQVSDAVSCTTPSLEDDVSGPFDLLKCTIEARGDEDKCEESVDAEGDPCDYCTISSNGQEAGICVTSDLADKMIQINPDQISCDIKKVNAAISDASGGADTACLKVGMAGGDAASCRNTVEDTTGEHCVFCSSPNLDNLGLCMSSSYRGKHGRYYTCDAGDQDIILSVQ